MEKRNIIEKGITPELDLEDNQKEASIKDLDLDFMKVASKKVEDKLDKNNKNKS